MFLLVVVSELIYGNAFTEHIYPRWFLFVLLQMDERGLLADALKQLDELFLLVVVGEFNSGKSSVINALLGGRFLEEGILPTTNEISVLKFAEREEDAGSVQNADGFYVSFGFPSNLFVRLEKLKTHKSYQRFLGSSSCPPPSVLKFAEQEADAGSVSK